MNNFIVIITCSKTKLDVNKPVPVYDLYSSKLAHLKRDLALELVDNDISRVFVISGTLGLVPIYYYTLPYDSKFKSLSNIKYKIFNQTKRYGLFPNDPIIFIGSKKYGNYLQKYLFPRLKYIDALEGAKGSTDYMLKIERLFPIINQVKDSLRKRFTTDIVFSLSTSEEEDGFLIFHALHSYNLSQLAKLSKDKTDGYLIAPSIGITKLINISKKFGDIIFLMKYSVLKKLDYPIYDRDIWSPKINMIPEELYEFNPTNKIKDILDEYIINEIKEKWEETFPKNPDTFRRFVLLGWFQDYLFELYDEQYTDQFDDDYEFFAFITNNLIQKKERTLESMITYLQNTYKELKGQDVFAYAYAYASKQIPISKLLNIINEKLLSEEDEIDFEEIKEKQWKILHLLKGREDFLHTIDVQTVGGKLLQYGIFENFKKVFYKGWYGLDPDRTLDNLEKNNLTLKDYYLLLKKWIVDIPSEYFEVKTLKLVSINNFYLVLIPLENYNQNISLLKKYLHFKGDIIVYNKAKIDLILKNNMIQL